MASADTSLQADQVPAAHAPEKRQRCDSIQQVTISRLMRSVQRSIRFMPAVRLQGCEQTCASGQIDAELILNPVCELCSSPGLIFQQVIHGVDCGVLQCR